MADWSKILAGAAILGTVFTASGQKKEKSGSSSGRKDLFGTHLCNYGKRDENGWRIGCNISCPVHSQCTQRGHYKR